ncbi:hypothetical protein Efla_006397 [Eimeria flavescens]
MPCTDSPFADILANGESVPPAEAKEIYGDYPTNWPQGRSKLWYENTTKSNKTWTESATIIRHLGWGPTEGERDRHNLVSGRNRRGPNSSGSNRWAGAQTKRQRACGQATESGRGTTGPEDRGGGDPRSIIGHKQDDCLVTFEGSNKSFPEDKQTEPEGEPGKVETKWYYLEENDAGEEAVMLAVEGDTFEPRDDEDDEKSDGQEQPQTHEGEELEAELSSIKPARNEAKCRLGRGGLAPHTLDWRLVCGVVHHVATFRGCSSFLGSREAPRHLSGSRKLARVRRTLYSKLRPGACPCECATAGGPATSIFNVADRCAHPARRLGEVRESLLQTPCPGVGRARGRRRRLTTAGLELGLRRLKTASMLGFRRGRWIGLHEYPSGACPTLPGARCPVAGPLAQGRGGGIVASALRRGRRDRDLSRTSSEQAPEVCFDLSELPGRSFAPCSSLPRAARPSEQREKHLPGPT